MKAKRKYEKPAMQVFEVENSKLLQSSGGGGASPLNPFTPGGDPLSNS